ncbi:hypothetical protein [Methylobacterium sp. WL6]|uniref:hypothetical protein n=1 Tax=Methylobacterium sp. WL6 TaxID=2603901 RepID=UPI0011CA50CC|nr:hypothetical protein [Methylobacterium sp. WL6]TXN71737.1 hypothetical protein FV230_07390 [Methylobacterium sp. WL6]
MMFGPRVTIPAAPSPLARIIYDLTSAGVRVTPLAILSHATDQDLTDDQVAELVAALDKIAFSDAVAA